MIALNDTFWLDLCLFVDSNQLLVPKLTSARITITSKHIQLIETFVNNYQNLLKSFAIRAHYDVEREKTLNDYELNVLMKQIVYLKNLNQLELSLQLDETNSNEQIVDNLKSIAIHCNQLKRLKLCLTQTIAPIDKQVFNCLRFFKNLNFLELYLMKIIADKHNNNQNEEISCHSLKELKLLTHLKLENPEMNDIFFEDIDKHLPQLKHLEIRVDSKITDKAMKSLSKLEELQSIIIKLRYRLPFITDLGLIDLINNCPQINSIVFNCKPNITHETIDALIALALRKPRIHFNHHFDGYYSSAEDMIFNRFDSKDFQLPNNLVMNKL